MAARPMVDLPAPDSPIRPSTSPRRKVMSMPRTISCHLSSLKPSMRRFLISSSGAPFSRGTDAALMLIPQTTRSMQEPVDDEVDGDRQKRDGGCRQQRRDVAISDQRRILPHHRAPVGGRRLNADAEEGERRDGEEDEA